MAWVKFTTGRIIWLNADNKQISVHPGNNLTLYDPDSWMSETDDEFDPMSQEWGMFTQDENLAFSGTGVSSGGRFAGTFQASNGDTIYVLTFEHPQYGTYNALITPGAGDKTGEITTQGLINQFTAKAGNITDPPHTVPCFLPGTLVATPAGERMVEDLAAGDMVLTAREDAVPLKWVGRSVVSTRFGPAGRLMPVRFASGSLGGQPLLPHRDLTVTADHAVLVDGILCEAGALVNGTTITRAPLTELGESYTVYHVETDAHEIILANGAPAETFVDNASRKAFDNYAEFEALYGEHPPEMVELPHPRAANARQLPRRIRDRFGLAGAEDEGRAA